MEKKVCIEDFSLEELDIFIEEIEIAKSKKDLLARVKNVKKQKERSQSLNKLLTLDVIIGLRLFPVDVIELLIDNGVVDFADLLERDISSLKGIGYSTREYLEWAKKFFDMSGIKSSYQKRKTK